VILHILLAEYFRIIFLESAFVIMAEANGNRTHPGPSRPHTGFEDQGHHQAPVTSAIA
jgi:hypothetical protein